MKKISLSLLLVITSLNLFANSGDLQKRMDEIQRKRDALELKEKELSQFRDEIQNYKSPKLIDEENLALKKSQEKIDVLINENSSVKDMLRTDYLSKKMNALKENENLLKEFLDKQEKLKNLEQSAESKLLKNYIKLTNERKSNLAKGVFFTLKEQDKKDAEEYEKIHDFLDYNSNMPPSWEKEIKILEKDISDDLLTLEIAEKELQEKLKGLKTEKEAFANIQKEHEKEQFKLDFTSSPQLNIFECKNNAQYIMPKHVPGVMFLKSAGNLKAAIKVNANHPGGFEVLDVKMNFNEERLLCKVDPICEANLKKSEEAYKRDEFFSAVKSQLISQELLNIKEGFLGTDKNELLIFEEMKMLGHYTKEEYIQMLNPLIDYTKDLSGCSVPADCHTKVLAKISEIKKQWIAKATEKNNKYPDPEKKRKTENVIAYIFNSKAESEINTLFKSKNSDYPIQDRAYEQCPQKGLEWKDFCEASMAWRDRLKLFKDADEVSNLNSKNCNQGIFRIQPKDQRDQKVCAPDGVIENLQQDMDKIEKKIKQ
jgi:hypothetical protein